MHVLLCSITLLQATKLPTTLLQTTKLPSPAGSRQRRNRGQFRESVRISNIHVYVTDRNLYVETRAFSPLCIVASLPSKRDVPFICATSLKLTQRRSFSEVFLYGSRDRHPRKSRLCSQVTTLRVPAQSRRPGQELDAANRDISRSWRIFKLGKFWNESMESGSFWPELHDPQTANALPTA